MHATLGISSSGKPEAMLREIRTAFRLSRVGLHLCWGALTVVVIYPWIDTRLKRALKRRWSRQLLEMLGVRLKLGAGKAAPPPGLIVSNHISWLDIFVINALVPAAFVSKAEVRSWPLIGWLCAHTETIFLARGSRSAVLRCGAAMASRLRAGGHVAFFPEGTTSDGSRVLPFHPALFQSAIDAQAPVIPLALRYTDRNGNPSRAPAYDGDITLWQCLWAIARTSGLSADLRVLEPLAVAAFDRQTLAVRCREAISWHLGQRGFVNLPALSADIGETDIEGQVATQ